MSRVGKRGGSCDPLDGRAGFKDGGQARPALELNNPANEDSHSSLPPTLSISRKRDS
jgi:hypothetical protein